MKIDKATHVDIIEAYTVDLWPTRKIAEVLHVSHACIYKLLRKHGIDTTKHKLTVSCTTCGADIERTKKRVFKQRNHFCNEECYTSFMRAGAEGYTVNRNFQRSARAVVSNLFDLQTSHVVHHKDRNPFNNHPSNLMVFANQGDHIRFHHQMRHEYANPITNKRQEVWERYNHVTVPILWDGSITR